MILDSKNSILCVVDIQERLLPHMHNKETVLRGSSILIQAAKTLDVPVLVTEQYPKGLGHTVPEIQAHIEGVPVYEKTTFSCFGNPDFAQALKNSGRNTLILCGIESHVCVLQTALETLNVLARVVVVADATGSRSEDNHTLALKRLRHSNVEIVSVEMALMEWLRDAKNPKFKEVQALIKG